MAVEVQGHSAVAVEIQGHSAVMVEVQERYAVAVEVQGHSALAVEEECSAEAVEVWEQRLDDIFCLPSSLSAAQGIFFCLPSFSAAQCVFLGPPVGIQTQGGVL